MYGGGETVVPRDRTSVLPTIEFSTGRPLSTSFEYLQEAGEEDGVDTNTLC